jgi:tRNA (guanine-N(7)-)-methyltransferase subunit TRM82
VGDGGGNDDDDDDDESDESESDESDDESDESEAYELRIGMAYGTRVVVAEWRGMDGVRVDDDEDGDDGEDDAMDSDDEYGGYSSSSSEDDIKRMKRRRERPLTPAKMIELKDDATPHTGIIRVFKVSDDGKWFITAGDDKMVKLWSTDSWTCARTVSMPKKVSAAAFTHGGWENGIRLDGRSRK